MDYKGCSHGKLFTEPCIECELILARSALEHSKDDVVRFTAKVAKLEAEAHVHGQSVEGEKR